MIDAENEIFSIVATSARTEFAGLYMTSEYVKSPSSFPCVSLVEMDNQIYRNTQSTSGMENHAEIMYELNVYSNKTKGKKSECRDIVAFIDSQMSALGFSRTMLSPIPNMDDATIYRMTGRYKALISQNKTIYRR